MCNQLIRCWSGSPSAFGYRMGWLRALLGKKLRSLSRSFAALFILLVNAKCFPELFPTHTGVMWLTIYRWGYPLILGIMDVHIASRTFCSFPANSTFIIMVSMVLHSCACIGLLTSIVRTYLCQNAPGEIWKTKPYEKYKQRSETRERDRSSCLLA